MKWCEMCQSAGKHKEGCPNTPPVMHCSTCGEPLYFGDVLYPELDACYNCISECLSQYEETVRGNG